MRAGKGCQKFWARQKILFEKMAPLCMYLDERERETGQGGRESLDLPDSVSSAENNIYLSGGCVVSQ